MEKYEASTELPVWESVEISERPKEKVDHPEHYRLSNGAEAIDIMESVLSPEELTGFLKGNVLKYVIRHGKKDGQTDLKKARWYLDRMIEGGKE